MEWTSIKFSNDGKKILIGMSIAQLKIIDAFQGHELNTLTVSQPHVHTVRIIRDKANLMVCFLVKKKKKKGEQLGSVH